LKLNKDADMHGSINSAVASLRKVAKLYSSERRWDGMTVFNPKVSKKMSSVHVLALLKWVLLEALSTGAKFLY
jgi:hypothetical protein